MCSLRPIAAVVALTVIGASCSGDDDAATSATTGLAPGPTAGLPVTTPAGAAPGSEASGTTAELGGEVDADEGAAESDDTADSAAATEAPSASTTPTSTTLASTAPTSAEASVVTVPETGVPGLDSADSFCAAWSRFGGTWQVLLVGSTFLGDPDTVARWEVSSAPLVLDAYESLLGQLPAELEAERSAVADGYFGAFQRRALSANEAFTAAGGTGSDARALAGVWLEALAARDPSTPGLAFIEPDDLAGLVDSAATELLSQRTEFHLDPSLIVTADTPLTDAYLEANCPDQGTLAGGEIDA